MSTTTDANRRSAIKGLLGAAIATSLPACSLTNTQNINSAQSQAERLASSEQDWLKAGNIRRNTVRPQFPDSIFSLADYLSDGNKNDCTEAFRKAILDCHNSGGGRVSVPAGEYFTGPIHLLSKVNLHLEKDALVKFIPEPKRYLPAVHTRWEGMELMGYSPLIYAFKQKDIAITGEGEFDGGADNNTWWPWKGPHKESHWTLIPGEDQKPARDKLQQDLENAVPVEQRLYAEGAFLRPPLLQPYACENVLVEGVTIRNSPFWLINPVLCKHVTVSAVKFISHGPNSDGCNPESCDHVVIEKCFFDTGDDCIAIKSGRNADGRRINVASQNIVISDCTMHAGHGGVVIGSEISGGVNNVFVENCTMDSPDLERAIRIKTNSVRGGLIEHLRYRNITVGRVKSALVINFYYEEGDAGKFDPTVRDIVIENMTVDQVLVRPFNLQGFDRKPITDIHLIDSHFRGSANEVSIVKNINDFTLHNVSVNGKNIDVNDWQG